ncbi:MAG: Type 1 glutamine amidotransferase-like domain-containing protein [Candidatus Vogelbacteria bacterium]|nr:Type 1 glutamine amidotransferase-like domain-containing protein [Candidatus Vogelbacteria bacterium]
MRLFLTSSGFPKSAVNCKREFLDLVGKPTDQIRVAYVPTASYVEKNKTFAEIDRRELIELGIPEANVVDFELDHEITCGELSKFNVIFVDGGNTFYLLQEIKKSGFDKAISEYLKKDLGVYVGVSAGTVVAGPDIDFVADWDDRSQAPELKSTTALCLIEIAYSPHYTDSEAEIVEKLREKYSYPIKKLRDGRAILVNGSRARKIEN